MSGQQHSHVSSKERYSTQSDSLFAHGATDKTAQHLYTGSVHHIRANQQSVTTFARSITRRSSLAPRCLQKPIGPSRTIALAFVHFNRSVQSTHLCTQPVPPPPPPPSISNHQQQYASVNHEKHSVPEQYSVQPHCTTRICLSPE